MSVPLVYNDVNVSAERINKNGQRRNPIYSACKKKEGSVNCNPLKNC